MHDQKVIDLLMQTDQTFRHLKEEHKKFEAELQQISRLSFPTGEQERREIDLKKKKLHVKDQMERVISEYRLQ